MSKTPPARLLPLLISKRAQIIQLNKTTITTLCNISLKSCVPILRNKKIIKVTLSSITRIRLIIYIEDSEEVFSIDHAHIEDIKVEETTVTDIITTSHPVRSNTTSVINLDAG